MVSRPSSIVILLAGLIAGIFGLTSVFSLLVVGLVQGESIGVVFGLARTRGDGSQEHDMNSILHRR